MSQQSSAPPHYPISGWVEAAYTFAIALLSLAYVVGHQLGAHPIAFVLYAMLFSAVVLLAVTGIRAPMRCASCWRRRAGSWASASSAWRSSTTFCSTMSRQPTAVCLCDWLFHLPGGGLGAVCTATAAPRDGCRRGLPRNRATASDVEPEHRGHSAAAVLAAASMSTLRSFAAEFHPWNRRAATVMEKLRVTGLLVLVTSVASLVLAALVAILIAAGLLPPTMMPTRAQMMHGPTVLLAFLVGSVVLTAMALLSFSAVVKITTENFAASHRLHARRDAARAIGRCGGGRWGRTCGRGTGCSSASGRGTPWPVCSTVSSSQVLRLKLKYVPDQEAGRPQLVEVGRGTARRRRASRGPSGRSPCRR